MHLTSQPVMLRHCNKKHQVYPRNHKPRPKMRKNLIIIHSEKPDSALGPKLKGLRFYLSLSDCFRAKRHVNWFQNSLYKQFIQGLYQWFLTLLEVLNPTCSIHAFLEPFVVAIIKCVS